MYSLKYHKRVIKFLKKQDKSFKERVVFIFNELRLDPNVSSFDIKPLKGFENRFRVRVGKYRIIYTIDDEILLIEVIKADSRGDIYK